MIERIEHFVVWAERYEPASKPANDLLWGYMLVCEDGPDFWEYRGTVFITNGHDESSRPLHLSNVIHVHDRMYDRGYPYIVSPGQPDLAQSLLSSEPGYRVIYDASIDFRLEPRFTQALPGIWSGHRGFGRGEAQWGVWPADRRWAGLLFCKRGWLPGREPKWHLRAFSRFPGSAVQVEDRLERGVITGLARS